MRGQEEHEYIKRTQMLEDELKKEKDGHRDLTKHVREKGTLGPGETGEGEGDTGPRGSR